MNLLRTVALALAATAGISQAQVADSLLERLPGDTQVIYGMRVKNVLASTFGQFLFAQIPAQNPLQQMAAMTGFDATRDLDEIVIASAGPSPGTGMGQPLILLRGAFPSARFLDIAKLSGATNTEYRGIPIVTPQQKGMQGSLALLDGSTLAFGPAAALNAVIDHASGISTALADKARASSSGRDIWFATITPLASLVGNIQGPVPPALLQAIRETSGGVLFTPDSVNLGAEAVTTSANDAQSMAGMLKFVAGMAASPQVPALKNAQFEAAGSTVKMTLSIPEQEIERMTKSNVGANAR